MEKSILEKAKAWASNSYFEESSRKEIEHLLAKNDEKELTERFYREIEFGTGGLRSIIGAGNNRMNKYTVRKATQALATVLKKEKKDHSVAISYDSRNFSFEFSKEVASVLAGNGIKALIYKRLNPVCLLSWSVRYHKASAGVMITASHNPPNYNGYKCFWSDGAQVTPPNDQNIIDAYNAITDFGTIKMLDFEAGVKEGLIKWVGEDVENAYHEMLKDYVLNPKLIKERGSELKMVYTPIHGSGFIPCTRVLKDLGFTDVHVVEEQKLPDGNFPTVKSPNPENPDALKLAVDLMKKVGADFAVGTDPDADRLGVALQKNGETIYLSGNQMGVLMLHYMLKNLSQQNRMPKNPYFVKTIVTTELQTAIAKHFGVDVENTLTGFKWICGRVMDLSKIDPSKTFLFGTEESFGYLTHPNVRDKDGVGPLGLIAEMALYYKTKGKTLLDALDDIYTEFGFYTESLLSLDYFGIEGGQKIARIMTNFRNYKSTEMCGDKIVNVEDYESPKSKLPKSNVLGFEFTSGNKVYLRPSGTEPKIKFYIMLKESTGTLEEKRALAAKKSSEIIEFLKKEAERA